MKDIFVLSGKGNLLEIFAENTCNFKCVYCNWTLSSRIEQENKQFGSEIVQPLSPDYALLSKEKTKNFDVEINFDSRKNNTNK